MQRLSRTLIHLNVVTREHHAAADAPWLDLMGATVEKQAYASHLIRVYGFEAPLEAAFRYTPGLAVLLDLRVRTRAGLIVQDLMRLGLGPARIAQLEQRFATFSTAAEALGWMYVAERSTLLHGAVRRYLALRIPEAADALSYLSAYDGVAAARWSDLGNALDAVAEVPSVKRQLLRATHEGFLALCEWHHGGLALQPVGT
jgi:heme oxygenase